MNLSESGLAMVLACSHVALPGDEELTPLTLRNWNALARKLYESELRPKDLLGKSAGDLQTMLGMVEEDAIHLAGLLDRADPMRVWLERWTKHGIGVMTRMDAEYPARYRDRLKDSAPPVLFYAGEPALLGQPGIAVVGSRRLDAAGQESAAIVGNACGLSGRVLYSGGAKGVDTISMMAALDARGAAVALLADSLERAARASNLQPALREGNLCLATPYSPTAGFSVGAAMGRNRLIYAAADYAVVVASNAGTGGTWAGANEALRHEWLPVFVLEHSDMPDGNRQLLERGALPLPYPIRTRPQDLPGWFAEHCKQGENKPTQLGLF